MSDFRQFFDLEWAATLQETVVETGGGGTPDPNPDPTPDPTPTPSSNHLWASYSPNPKFDAAALRPVEQKLRRSIIYAFTNLRSNLATGVWTKTYENQYNFRWAHMLLDGLALCYYRSGDKALLNIASEFIDGPIFSAVKTRFEKWPTNVSLPTDSTWTNPTRSGDDRYKSPNYFNAERNNLWLGGRIEWFASDQANGYERFLYKHTGNLMHFGTDTQSMEEMICYSVLHVWSNIFELAAGKQGAGDRNWTANRDRLHSHIFGSKGFWAKTENRRTRDPDGTFDYNSLSHPALDEWKVYHFAAKIQARRGIRTQREIDNERAAKAQLAKTLNVLDFTTVPAGAASGLAIPIASPTQYEMAFLPHKYTGYVTSHDITYQGQIGTSFAIAHYEGATDTQGRSYDLRAMKALANATGFAHNRDVESYRGTPTITAGLYVRTVSGGYINKIYNGAEFQSRWKGALTVAFGGHLNRGDSGFGTLAFDYTAEKYTTKIFRYTQERLSNGTNITGVLANPESSASSDWCAIMALYHQALEQRDFDVTNVKV